MLNNNESFNFNADSSAIQSALWLRMEQAETSDNTASLGDLNQMITSASSGISALDYALRCCPEVKLKEDSLTISLVVYLYPSILATPYMLSAEWGAVSSQKLVKQAKSFDIIFDNIKKYDFNFIFDGTALAQTPFFDKYGAVLSDIAIDLAPTYISTSKDTYCVFRAQGYASCYEHTITMVLQRKYGYRVSDLKNSLALSYIDSNGKIISSKLDLKFPACAEKLLDTCDDGTLKVTSDIKEDIIYSTNIYYSTCTGQVLLIAEEPQK